MNRGVPLDNRPRLTGGTPYRPILGSGAAIRVQCTVGAPGDRYEAFGMECKTCGARLAYWPGDLSTGWCEHTQQGPGRPRLRFLATDFWFETEALRDDWLERKQA